MNSGLVSTHELSCLSFTRLSDAAVPSLDVAPPTFNTNGGKFLLALLGGLVLPWSHTFEIHIFSPFLLTRHPSLPAGEWFGILAFCRLFRCGEEAPAAPEVQWTVGSSGGGEGGGDGGAETEASAAAQTEGPLLR